jgi:integrase
MVPRFSGIIGQSEVVCSKDISCPAAAKTHQEHAKRRQSNLMTTYRNHAGRYADFHSCRHLFITNLERAGIRPKMAQTLARHSDVRLTLGVYTHVELHDQTAAIESLPAPPAIRGHNLEQTRGLTG